MREKTRIRIQSLLESSTEWTRQKFRGKQELCRRARPRARGTSIANGPPRLGTGKDAYAFSPCHSEEAFRAPKNLVGKALLFFYVASAITSISTCTSLGSPATATVARAGGSVLKYRP